MKYYVFDDCMNEEYIFDTEEQVKEFLQGILDGLDEEDCEGALDEIRVIKGELVVIEP